MLNELEVLKIVITRLDSAGISYMVSGSVAANFYTTPRMTRDIDVVIEAGSKDAEKLYSLFLKDFYIDMKAVKEAIRNQKVFNIIHNESIVKVDFIIRKETDYRKTEFERRRKIAFEDLNIYITSPEDLIISKLYWAKDSFSEKQLTDVKNLMGTIPEVDREYIQKWVKKLGIEKIYKEVSG